MWGERERGEGWGEFEVVKEDPTPIGFYLQQFVSRRGRCRRRRPSRWAGPSGGNAASSTGKTAAPPCSSPSEDSTLRWASPRRSLPRGPGHNNPALIFDTASSKWRTTCTPSSGSMIVIRNALWGSAHGVYWHFWINEALIQNRFNPGQILLTV